MRNQALALLLVMCLSSCTPRASEVSNHAAVTADQIQAAAGVKPDPSAKENSTDAKKAPGDFVNSSLFAGVPLTTATVKADIESRLRRRPSALDLTWINYYEQHYTKDDLSPLSTPLAIDSVRKLNLKKVGITDDQLESVGKLKLSCLWLSGNPVKDLHALRNMRSLSFLDLDHTQVDARGMKVVGRLDQLTALNLTGTSISDADLSNLYDTKTLAKVELLECKKISPSAVAQLKKKLPQCKVNQ